MSQLAPSTASGFNRVLDALGISPRPFRALVKAQVLMDFRSQYFARATATGPKAMITPT